MYPFPKPALRRRGERPRAGESDRWLSPSILAVHYGPRDVARVSMSLPVLFIAIRRGRRG